MKIKPKTLVTLIAGLWTATALTGRAQTTFTKITTGDIVNDPGIYMFCAWGDYNNDGFLDLFVSNYNDRTNALFLNNGNGTFTRVTQAAPVEEADYHCGVAAADYDNDGHLDLVTSAGTAAPTARPTRLYHNEAGTFRPVSGDGVTTPLGYFWACAWADYDNDGLVDLVITDNGSTDFAGGKNLLWHNQGNGAFTRITSGPVADDLSHGTAALWADYDNDGFMDLLILNAWVPNQPQFLYHNNRDGTFTRVLTNTIATDSWPMGATAGAWGDYDNDGLPDLFLVDNNGVRNRLYHNGGNGVFTNVVDGPMLAADPGTYPRGCAWGDYDNDGYLDLFVAVDNGNHELFHNNGDGTFSRILAEPPVEDGGPGIGAISGCWVDYDNDGFLDLCVTQASTDSGDPAPLLLYHNNGNTNAWLEVKCIGQLSNRSAIGAKVRVHATIGGKAFWQLREIHSGGGWDGQPLVAHFGLGDATNVDTLRIEWPSGIVQTLTNVPPRQILTVVEHQQPGPPTPPRFTQISRSSDGTVSLVVSADPNLRYLLEASTNLVDWAWLGVGINFQSRVLFTDPQGSHFPSRFYRVKAP